MVPSSAILRFDLSAPFTEFSAAVNRSGFVGPSVLRPRVVGIQSANVGKIKLEQLLQSKSTRRVSGTGYSRGQWEFDQYSYACSGFGWEEPLDDEQVAIFADLVDAENVSAGRAIDFVLGEYERDVASKVFDTATWTGGLTTGVGTAWSTAATADPIQDVDTAREAVVTNSGLEPNALVINKKNWRYLIKTAAMVDRIKYTARATVDEIARAVADILDLRYIIVAGGIKNTANQQQARSIARIWGNGNAMVCRVAESDDPQEPCIGRTFIWTGDGPGAGGTNEELAVIVEQYREEAVRGMVTRARNNRDLQIMYKEAGFLLTGVSA